MDTAFGPGDTRPHVFVGITDEDGLGVRERRVTFAVLLFSPVEALAQTGFAVAAGLLLDTFIVRTLSCPPARPCSRTAAGGHTAGRRAPSALQPAPTSDAHP